MDETMQLIALLIVMQGLPSIDHLPTWHLTRELRIGSYDDPATSLTGIYDVAVAADGRMLLSQPMEKQVAVFSASGERLGTIGSPGNGPMEIKGLGQIGWRGDSVWVEDSGGLSLKVFTASGRWLRTISFDLSHIEDYLIAPGPLLSDGSILGSVHTDMDQLADGIISQVPLIRFTRAGQVLDTLTFEVRANSANRVRLGTGFLIGERTFGTNDLVAVAADGSRIIVVRRAGAARAKPPAIEILALTGAGDTVFLRKVRFTPLRLTDDIIDDVVEDFLNRLVE